MSSHGTMEVKATGASDYEELGYLDGFVPSTFDAPHSSLQRSSTWIGMGLILVSLAGFGIAIYGFAVNADTYAIVKDTGVTIGIVGLIIGVVLAIAGATSIHIGRKGYREYTKATGRMQ